MNKTIAIAAIIALPVITGGLYYFFAYPPVVLRHRTELALHGFGDAVATQDRSKVADTLRHMLAGQAHIRLSVRSPVMADGTPPAQTQELDKAQFLSFVDNVLYSLKNYSFSTRLQTFTLQKDYKSAAIVFSAQGGGDDLAYYTGMPASIRLRANISCASEVHFTASSIVFGDTSCTLQLHAAETRQPQ